MLTTDTIIQKQIIKRHQTAVDFTIQNSGTLESLFDVLQLNGFGATDDIAPGTVLQAPVVERSVINYYKGSEADVITFLRPDDLLGGIGYMQIGTSFIVS